MSTSLSFSEFTIGKYAILFECLKKKNLMFCWTFLFRAVADHMHTKRSHYILWVCRKQWRKTHKLEIRWDLFHIFHNTHFPPQLASPFFSSSIILVNLFVTQITFGSVMRLSWWKFCCFVLDMFCF